MNTYSSKAGTPPGTLLYVGEEKSQPITFTVITYDESDFKESNTSNLDEALSLIDSERITWLNVDGVHDAGIVQTIGEKFNLHPLTREDILNTEQRPKVEDFGSYIYIVVKMVTMKAEQSILPEQVSLVFDKHLVISFQERQGDVFESVRDRLRKNRGRIRKSGADYLAYSLIDAIVDGYFIVLESIGGTIEEIEDDLVERPDPSTLQGVYLLRRELLFLHKSVWPMREVVSALERYDGDLIDQSTRVYLKDAYDHTFQVADTLETNRDMVNGMIDIYLSSMSNRMNEIMKVLTIIATIFIPLTFITGIYGMNFKFMPELEYPLAYPLALLGMLIVASTEILYFHRRGWL